MKEAAIDKFINANSFNEAYDVGLHVIIPHCIYFESHDLSNLLDKIFSNSRHNINQIINAGSIDEVFALLFDETSKNILNSGSIWKEFWVSLTNRYTSLNYEQLKERLISSKIIEPELDQPYEPQEDARQF